MSNICIPIDKIDSLESYIESLLPCFDNLLIINNSEDYFTYNNNKVRIVKYNINIGRPASWNLLLNEDYENYYFILNPVIIDESDIKNFLDIVKVSKSWMIISDLGIIAIKKESKEKVGFFDENYYPYGLEIEDYKIRVQKLSGGITYCNTGKEVKESIASEDCIKYFFDKWGILPIENYKKSKNSLEWSLDYNRIESMRD